MSGTIVCGVTDTEDGRAAAQLAGALAERLDVRLVYAHALDGIPRGAEESVTARQRLGGAERALTAIARENAPARGVELRIDFGERAQYLAEVAAEEGADLVVLGSRAGGLRRPHTALHARAGAGGGHARAGARRAAADAPAPRAAPRAPRGSRRGVERIREPQPTPASLARVCDQRAAARCRDAAARGTPLTISAPIALVEGVVLAVGLALMLVANVMLLRPAFAPLDRLLRRMQTVDLLRPGQRLAEGGGVEVTALVRAFNEMLERLEVERHESSRRILAAQEAERRRIALGLHDEVGQVLTGVLLQLDALGGSAGRDVAETKQAVRQALEEVRRIAQELRPEMLEQLGLVSALTELATKFAAVSGIQVDRSLAAELPPLSPDAELAIYRVAQESLTNVARHAGASHVELALGRGPTSVVLRVSDDGRGFEDGVVPNGNGGLRGMRERALLVGGALAIKRGPEHGVEVRLEVPAAR